MKAIVCTLLGCLLVGCVIGEEWHEMPTAHLTVDVVQEPEIKEKLFIQADGDENGVVDNEQFVEFLIDLVDDSQAREDLKNNKESPENSALFQQFDRIFKQMDQNDNNQLDSDQFLSQNFFQKQAP